MHQLPPPLMSLGRCPVVPLPVPLPIASLPLVEGVDVSTGLAVEVVVVVVEVVLVCEVSTGVAALLAPGLLLLSHAAAATPIASERATKAVVGTKFNRMAANPLAVGPVKLREWRRNGPLRPEPFREFATRDGWSIHRAYGARRDDLGGFSRCHARPLGQGES